MWTALCDNLKLALNRHDREHTHEIENIYSMDSFQDSCLNWRNTHHTGNSEIINRHDLQISSW